MAASRSDGFFLVRVAQFFHVLVAEQGVVVEIHLGVESDDIAGTRHDQRVDLDDGGVKVHESLVGRHDELDRGVDLFALKPQPKGQLAGVEAGNPGGRVDRDFQNLLRGVVGDLFDLHPAFGRSHDGDAGGGAVQQQAQIQLALDVAAFLDIQPLHFLAGRPGLLGHQHLTQHLAGIGYNVLDRLDDAHAALSLGVILETAGASAARMDLGLHHPDRAAQLVRDLFGFGSR